MRRLTEGTYTIRFYPNINNISESIIKQTKWYYEGVWISEEEGQKLRRAFFNDYKNNNNLKCPSRLDNYFSYAMIDDGITKEYTLLKYGKSIFDAIKAPLTASIVYYSDGRIYPETEIDSKIKRAKDRNSNSFYEKKDNKLYFWTEDEPDKDEYSYFEFVKQINLFDLKESYSIKVCVERVKVPGQPNDHSGYLKYNILDYINDEKNILYHECDDKEVFKQWLVDNSEVLDLDLI